MRRYYICKVCISYSLSALAQLEGLRTIIQRILILAVCITSSGYGCLASQVVDNLNGYVLLVCVYILNIQLIPSCAQLRQTDTIAPVQQGCMLAILTWLNWLAVLNDAYDIYIYYIYVRRYYICKVCISYSLSALAQLEGLRTIIQRILILAVCITSSGYGCLASQVVDNLNGYVLLVCVYILNIQLIPTCAQLRQTDTVAPVQQGCMLAILTWLNWRFWS